MGETDEGHPVTASEAVPARPQPLDLEDLFRAHHAAMLHAAFRITGKASDAEDAVQSVFLRLARREEARDYAPSPGAYLRRAAVNAALDLLRSRIAGTESVAGGDLDRAPGKLPGPDSSQREQELRSWLRSALARLSPAAAEVFTLHFVEGLANHEIATLLGKSRTVVNVLLHRARQQLRAQLPQRTGETR